MDMTTIIPGRRCRYTSSRGPVRAARALRRVRPLLQHGMFEKAGIASPPKTFPSCETDAKKLTVFNPDGSIKVAGFVPLARFYENTSSSTGTLRGEVVRRDGKPPFDSDPAWAALLEWQKNSSPTVYGPDGSTSCRSSSPSWAARTPSGRQQGFETGKVAMTIDGEWRTAFIKDDRSDVNYTTAPFPVADDIADLRRGQIGGDVIGIPRGARTRPRLGFWSSTWPPTRRPSEARRDAGQRADHVRLAEGPEAGQRPALQDLPEIFANPNSGFKPLTTSGTPTRPVVGLRRQMAGGEGTRSAGRACTGGAADRQAVALAAVLGRARSATDARRCRRAGREAPPPLAAAAPYHGPAVPVAVGDRFPCSSSIRCREPVLLLHALRPAEHPAVGRSVELQVHVHAGPLFWQSLRNTVWIIVIGVPLQIVFAIFMATCSPPTQAGVYRTIYFLPTMVPAVAAALAFVFLFNPRSDPSNHVLSGLGITNPPSGSRTPWSKPALVLLGLWGVGDTMIIFLAALLDVPASSTRRPTSRERARGRSSATSPCP